MTYLQGLTTPTEAAVTKMLAPTPLDCVVDQRALDHALQRVAPYAGRGRQLSPMLALLRLEVLIERDEEADVPFLVLAATDTEKGCRVRLPLGGLTLPTAGVACVDAQQLRDLVARLPAGEVSLKGKDYALLVGWGKRNQATIPGTDPEAYIDLPDSPQRTPPTALLPGWAVRDAVTLVQLSVAKEQTRPVLAGINLRLTPDTLVFGAADGGRCSLYSAKLALPPDGLPGELCDVILPQALLPEAAKLLPDKEGDTANVALWLGGQPDPNMAFVTLSPVGGPAEAGDTLEALCWFRLLAGTYPDLERVFPRVQPGHLHWRREVLDGALSRLLLFADPAQSHHVQVVPEPADELGTPDGVLLRASTPDRGQAIEDTEVVIEGTLPERWGLHGMMLRELLDAAGARGVAPEEELRMGVAGPLQPLVVTLPTLDVRCTFRHIIMPVHAV